MYSKLVVLYMFAAKKKILVLFVCIPSFIIPEI